MDQKTAKEVLMEVKSVVRPSPELMEGFRSISTSTISDLLDLMGIEGVISGLSGLKNGSYLVGCAVTVKEITGPRGTYPLEDFPIGQVIDWGRRGDVLVFDNGGLAISTWGGLASAAASVKGIAGVVIDGGCRDVDEIVALNFPVFCRHVTPTTGKTRIRILEMNGVIQCGGVQVRPGDIIVADGTGIVVIPAARAAEVLQQAMEVEKRERHFAEELRRGKTFQEMQRKTGVI
jgi:regulator of RNase E activity RraA